MYFYGIILLFIVTTPNISSNTMTQFKSKSLLIFFCGDYYFYKLYYDYVIIIFDTKLLFNPRTLQVLRGRFRNIQIDYVIKRECWSRNIEFGKRSSGDDRRCETVVGSTNKYPKIYLWVCLLKLLYLHCEFVVVTALHIVLTFYI